MTIRQLLHYAKQQLVPVTDNPALEAEILFAHALNQPRSYLYKEPNKIISDAQASTFAHYLQRRCNKEPIAYIIGTREFWSLELEVSPETLIPRPETELLVELILAMFPDSDKKIKAADLGTGSGAIALALSQERPAWQIYATDISESALHIAKKNAQRLARKNIIFSQGNWCAALPSAETDADFDVIVSNPPYIAETEWESYATGLAFEPRRALTSGADGLDAIRAISQTAKNYLKPGGYLVVEHGFLQAVAVRDIFAVSGYSDIVSSRDLSGHERATVSRYSP